jgi:hypothetical protein
MASLVGGSWGGALIVATQALVVSRVDMSSASRSKDHFNSDNYEDGRHGYQARHSRVAFIPKARQTWIGEGLEGGRQEVDEGCGNEHAGSKVP